MGRLRLLAFGSVLLTTITLQSAESPAPAPAPEPRPIAIVGGLIRTQTDAGEITGTILVRDGKIVELGPNVKVPEGALVIDAAKCVVVPGLIDAHGVVGLNAGAAKESGGSAGLDILDAVDPFADDWRDAARQGVTAVYVQTTGSLGGNGAVLRVGPTTDAAGLAIKSPAAVQANLGQTSAAPAQAGNPQLAETLARLGITLPQQQQAGPAPQSNTLTRYAQAEQLRGQIDSARRYSENKNARKDNSKELLNRAIKKEIPIRLAVGHEDDIRNALKIANDLGLRIVWEHLDRVSVIPEEFAATRASIVVGPLVGAKFPAETRKLALDGRRWAIGTFSDEPRGTAGLRLHAAAAVAAGCPRDAVMKALTVDAADLLGVGDKLGRLAVGRPADLTVIAGDPLDPSAPVRFTLTQGAITHNDSKAEIAPMPVVANPQLPEQLPQRYVIKTNRLLNLAGDFVPGELFVENGKLVDRGPSGVTIPTFDVGDAPVTPGLVAAHVGIETEACPDPDSAHLRAGDGLSPDDAKVRGYRDAGFLNAVMAPGSQNVIAGVIASVPSYDLGPGTEAGIKFVLTPTARDAQRFPVSLAGQFEFIDARLRGEPIASNIYLPPSLQAGLLAERDRNLKSALDRKITAWFEVNNRTEARAALRLIAEHKLKGVLLMPRQVEELSDEIRNSGAAVVVGPQKSTDAELMTRGLVALGKANVPLAFGGEVSDLRPSASWLVNAGLPRPVARRALTGQPPAAFGLPANTAKLGTGESADFVVWDGDPIDLASRAVAVVAQGQHVMVGPDDEPKKRTAPQAQPTTNRRRQRGD
jgi:imidazolonepropionase-like amidohydrolase